VSYRITWTIAADADLDRLFDHLLARELAREGGDLDYPGQAIAAVRACTSLLENFPFTCRKSIDNPFVRELVIPFGHTGYVALFEIVSSDQVVIAAIRQQREDDYY